MLLTHFSPTRDGRLSFAFVVPISFVVQQGRVQRGLADSIVSARYRIDLDALKQKPGARESYVVGIGGVELPTGTMDHDFMQGSTGVIAAGNRLRDGGSRGLSSLLPSDSSQDVK